MKEVPPLIWRRMLKRIKASNLAGECYIPLAMADIAFDPDRDQATDNTICYLMDRLEMRVYTFQDDMLFSVIECIRALSRMELKVREGFYDKSLNTEMYADIAKFKYCLGPWETDLDELEKVHHKIRHTLPYKLKILDDYEEENPGPYGLTDFVH